jgi:galactokinase
VDFEVGPQARLTPKRTVEATHFQLYKRAKHVFSEALRVLQFRQLSLSPPSDGNPLHEELGRLMNESQDSCRDLFECSSPELDELVKLCRESGAWGSRLTG